MVAFPHRAPTSTIYQLSNVKAYIFWNIRAYDSVCLWLHLGVHGILESFDAAMMRLLYYFFSQAVIIRWFFGGSCMKSTLRIGMAAVSLVSVLAIFAASEKNNDEAVALPRLAAVQPEVTVTYETLQATPLVDWDLKGEGAGHYDKKFRLNLSNGRYIDGAIIFNDCGDQSVGPTLGDPMKLDNTGNTGANAYNFNVLFSLQSTVEATFYFDLHRGGENLSSTSACLQVKHAKLKGDYHSSDFYTILESTDYADLTKFAGQGYFYSDAEGTYSTRTPNFTTGDDGVLYCGASGYTIVAFQFTYDDDKLLPGKQWISCALEEIKFQFACD